MRRKSTANSRADDPHRARDKPWRQRTGASLDQLESEFRGGRERLAVLVLHRFPTLAVLFGCSLLALTLIVAWNWIQGFVAPGTADERTNLLTATAQVAAGAFILLGLYFTARTYQVNREGQITERYTKAIDQVGKEELAFRLGGIYALERIAQDSPRDQPQIMEILTNLIRDGSPVSAERLAAWTTLVQDRKKLAYPFILGDPVLARDESNDEAQLKPDMQAIVTVLGRRSLHAGRRATWGFDLSRADLRRTTWTEGRLRHVNLMNCDLEETVLIGADLTQATLIGSNLSRAYVDNASLGGVSLRNILAFETGFYFTDFRAGQGYRAATFTNAILCLAKFPDARLSGVRFFSCNLDSVSFYKAKMDRVGFSHSSLIGTDFTDADLTGADLRDVDLSRCQGLTEEQVRKAVTNSGTKLPEDLRHLIRAGK